jgi:hypothetical protein
VPGCTSWIARSSSIFDNDYDNDADSDADYDNDNDHDHDPFHMMRR